MVGGLSETDLSKLGPAAAADANERYRTTCKGSFAEELKSTLSIADLDKESQCLETRLRENTARIQRAQEARARIQCKRYELTKLRESLHRRVNQLDGTLRATQEDIRLLEEENQILAGEAEKYMKINVLNDAFFVWYNGPYGTINNFRLGNLSTKVLDWLEINTALGQVALALSVVAQRLPTEKFLFTKYMIYPMGSQTKVYKVTDAMIKQMYHSSTNARMAAVHKYARDGSIVQQQQSSGGGGESAASSGQVQGPGHYNVSSDSMSTSNYNYNYHFDRFNSEHYVHYMQTHTHVATKQVGATAPGSAHGAPATHTEKAATVVYYPVQPLPTDAVLLNLYYDSSQIWFPKSKFNAAFFGLVCCIYELGEYIHRHDPPLTMPYKIDIDDGSGRACTICPTNPMNRKEAQPLDLLWHGTTPVANIGVNTGSLMAGNSAAVAASLLDEQWTRALKFALADVKWIVAWSTKHFAPS
jgi:hypothetical protein